MVGPLNRSENEPSVQGCRAARRSRAAGSSCSVRVVARSVSRGAGRGQVAGSWVMPAAVVGGGDRPVEGGPLGRRRWGAEHDGDRGVQHQGAAGQGVRAAVAGGEVEGVDPDPGASELDVRCRRRARRGRRTRRRGR